MVCKAAPNSALDSVAEDEMAAKRLIAAFLFAIALAAATPKPAYAVVWYCAACDVAESMLDSFNRWWDSVNPFPLW
jgi:hypothetical protein